MVKYRIEGGRLLAEPFHYRDERRGEDGPRLVHARVTAAELYARTGLQFLPFLLLTPFAGLVADRMPKQRLLQLTNIGMALPAAVLGILAVTGVAEVWHVYVLAFLLGSASAFDAPARQSFVSEIVSRDDLSNAVGLNSASFNMARIVGPAVAGFMIAGLGGGAGATGWVMLINAVSYAGPILALQRMRAEDLDTPDIQKRQKGMIRDGMRYIRSRPDVMMILAIVFFAGTFGLNFQMTSALMATEVFDKGASEYGILGTTMAVGSLAGALLAARRGIVRHRLRADRRPDRRSVAGTLPGHGRPGHLRGARPGGRSVRVPGASPPDGSSLRRACARNTVDRDALSSPPARPR